MSAAFYSCHLDCCVIWYILWQQKKVCFQTCLKTYSRHTRRTLRNEPHYPACITALTCFTFVSAVQMSTLAPTNWVYHWVVSIRLAQGCTGKRVSLTCRAGKCDRHLPRRMAGGVRMNRTADERAGAARPTFPCPPISPPIIQLLTDSVNETYHCDTVCVCGSVYVSAVYFYRTHLYNIL